MDTFKQLQTLSETPGPSGFEVEIAAAIEKEWRPYVDEFRRDRLGNLIGVKRGRGPESRPKILIAAHMDEIGLMVSEIVEHQKSGFLRVVNLGGVDIRHLYGQTVIVHGKERHKGVLGSLPPSFRKGGKISRMDMKILLWISVWTLIVCWKKSALAIL